MVPGIEPFTYGRGQQVLNQDVWTYLKKAHINHMMTVILMPPMSKGYSLLALVHSLEIGVVEERNEIIVKQALEKKFSTYNLDIDVDKSVQGMSALPVLETASLKRADVNVYDINRTKLVLQIEVHSSPIRDTVCKAIYGAADLLRLLRYTDENIESITVLVFPKMEECACVGKITVHFDSLHFKFNVKWLTHVSTVWDEIQCVLDENIRLMPALPQPDAVHSKYILDNFITSGLGVFWD